LASLVLLAGLPLSFGRPPVFQAPAPLQRKEQQPLYSVASIKPAKAGDARRPVIEFLPGGRFRSTNTPLFMILATAHQVPWQSIEILRERIKGIPDWMFNQAYDVEVTAAAPPPPEMTAKARNARVRLMLQAVLADRLKMRLRRENTEAPVYALLAGPRGVKLERAKVAERDCGEAAPLARLDAAPGCHQLLGGRGRGVHGTAVDMGDIAAFLSNWSELPVVDRTGVSGLYEIDTEGWDADESSSGRSLEDVLGRVGLRLVRRRAGIEVFTVEHAERPSAN
jgi:uncharacterized protein (TIGR03435 family)